MSDDKLLLCETLRERIYAWCQERFPDSTVNYVGRFISNSPTMASSF
ncbi:hypothetical protein [Nostoc sp.]